MMHFKKRCLVLLFFILFFMSFAFVYGYGIQGIMNGVNINEIRGVHSITPRGDLESQIQITFNIDANYSLAQDSITLIFSPGEHITNAPIQSVSILVCNVFLERSSNDEDCFKICSEENNCSIRILERMRPFMNGVSVLKNYSQYEITIQHPKVDNWQMFYVLINYTMPSFLYEQGDYSVAWLTFSGLESYTITNELILPSDKDIPRFIPDAKEINRLPYQSNGETHYRWAFTYEGSKDILLWYWNEQDVQDKEERLQRKYMVWGVIWGVIAGIISSLLISYYRKNPKAVRKR